METAEKNTGNIKILKTKPLKKKIRKKFKIISPSSKKKK